MDRIAFLTLALNKLFVRLFSLLNFLFLVQFLSEALVPTCSTATRSFPFLYRSSQSDAVCMGCKAGFRHKIRKFAYHTELTNQSALTAHFLHKSSIHCHIHVDHSFLSQKAQESTLNTRPLKHKPTVLSFSITTYHTRVKFIVSFLKKGNT